MADKPNTPDVVITIVVQGDNIMGEPLCEVHGVLRQGRKVTSLDYSGPIGVKPAELFESIQTMFSDCEQA